MAKDQNWSGVYAVVEAALADYGVPQRLPDSDLEAGYLADTITDHIVAAFETQPRR